MLNSPPLVYKTYTKNQSILYTSIFNEEQIPQVVLWILQCKYTKWNTTTWYRITRYKRQVLIQQTMCTSLSLPITCFQGCENEDFKQVMLIIYTNIKR